MVEEEEEEDDAEEDEEEEDEEAGLLPFQGVVGKNGMSNTLCDAAKTGAPIELDLDPDPDAPDVEEGLLDDGTESVSALTDAETAVEDADSAASSQRTYSEMLCDMLMSCTRLASSSSSGVLLSNKADRLGAALRLAMIDS